MKTLLIVRHAKSSWDHADLDDFDRPLNERGLRNAPEMARRLVLREMLPDLILCSPALRTISTARLFNQQFGRMDEGLKTEKSIYEASRQDLVKLISRQNPDLNIIMLVGHNPGLRAKTGSINGVRSYMGYLDAKGKRYSFSIMMNHISADDRKLPAESAVNFLKTVRP